jgi:hypothetical protein
LYFIGDSAGVQGNFYDDAWYHRWHLALLDLMRGRSEIDFIWKGLPSVDEAPDPLPNVLLRARIANVRYDARPFLSVLPETDRVITDFPSTALYEAVQFDKPVLALAFPPVSVRASAAAAFSEVYRPVPGVVEALAVIHSYLDDPPSAWRVPRGRLFPE